MGGISTSQEQCDATAEVKKINQIDSTKGATQALETMMSDFKKYRKNNGAACTSGYWNDVTHQLNSDSTKNLLPDLSVAWANEHQGSAAVLTPFSQNDLSNTTNNFNQPFSPSLMPENNQLPNSSWANSSDANSARVQADVTAFNSYLSNPITNRPETQSNIDLTAMAPLFAHGGALFKSLDTAENPGTALDGLVRTVDVDAWLKTAAGKPADDPIYNQANINYISALKDNKLGVDQYGNITTDGASTSTPALTNDDTEFTFIFRGHDGFNLQKLASQGGFTSDNNLDDTIQSYDKQMSALNATNCDTSSPSCTPPPATPCPPKDVFSALPKDQQAAINSQVNSDFVAQSAAHPGDGYIKIAARLLGKPQANDTDPDVYKLYREIEKADDHARLYRATSSNPATEALTPDLIKQLSDPTNPLYDQAFTAQMNADRQKLVDGNFGASS